METKICVTMFIYDPSTQKILIVKRSEEETFLPGAYEMPGGKLEFGENIFDGVKRESQEEIGFEAQVNEPYHVFDYLSKEGQRHNVEIVFLCKADSGQKVKLSESHTDYAWISQDEIDDYDITPEIKKAIIKGFTRVKA